MSSYVRIAHYFSLSGLRTTLWKAWAIGASWASETSVSRAWSSEASPPCTSNGSPLAAHEPDAQWTGALTLAAARGPPRSRGHAALGLVEQQRCPIDRDECLSTIRTQHEQRFRPQTRRTATTTRKVTVAEHSQQHVAADAFPPLPAVVGARLAIIPDRLNGSPNACGAFGARCLALLIGEERPGPSGRAQTCSMLCIPARRRTSSASSGPTPRSRAAGQADTRTHERGSICECSSASLLRE